MTDTAKVIAEYGILVVIAGAFLFMFYKIFASWLKQIECLKESHEKSVEGFLQTSNQFQQTAAEFQRTMDNFAVVLGNEQSHLTQAIERQTEMLESVCKAVGDLEKRGW
jgi:hypothetical protein